MNRKKIKEQAEILESLEEVEAMLGNMKNGASKHWYKISMSEEEISFGHYTEHDVPMREGIRKLLNEHKEYLIGLLEDE